MYPQKFAASVASIGNGLSVRPSLIEGAGRGLFATTAFRKNEIITWYDGERIDRKEAIRRKSMGKGTHLASASNYVVLDGLRTPAEMGRGAASFVNDARNSIFQNNAKLEKYCPSIFEHVVIRAKRDIAKGEEIFASYGNAYWQ